VLSVIGSSFAAPNASAVGPAFTTSTRRYDGLLPCDRARDRVPGICDERAPIVRFFIPAADDAQGAEHVWTATRTFVHQQLGWEVRNRRIFRLGYHHEGKAYVAEVGQPDARTGELVIVILESNAFLVCTGSRGVLRGEPVLVGHDEVRTVEDFDKE